MRLSRVGHPIQRCVPSPGAGNSVRRTSSRFWKRPTGSPRLGRSEHCFGREGLYGSHLTTWRREREAGARQGLSGRRGRKPKTSPEQKRVVALETRCARLERELDQARTIIGVQKKLCTLLGSPTDPSIENDS